MQSDLDVMGAFSFSIQGHLKQKRKCQIIRGYHIKKILNLKYRSQLQKSNFYAVYNFFAKTITHPFRDFEKICKQLRNFTLIDFFTTIPSTSKSTQPLT